MKTFWTIFASVMITALLASGGFYYFYETKYVSDKNALQSQINTLNSTLDEVGKKLLAEQSTNSTASSKDSSSTKSATDGWNVYQNSSYNFYFSYPTNWTSKESVSTSASQDLLLKVADSNNSETIEIGHYATLSKITTAKTLSAYLSDPSKFTSTKQITFAGLPAYETVTAGTKAYYEIFVQNGTSVIEIKFDNRTAKDKLTETDTNILSSFSFLSN